MDRDELLRLKQISGLAELFANSSFSIPQPKAVYTPLANDDDEVKSE